MQSNEISLYTPLFPAAWQRKPLHDLADWLNGLAFKPADFEKYGIPVIKIAEVKSGVSPQTKCTLKQFDKKFLLKSGDMLFCWSGQPETSIDTFIWKGPTGWLNQHIFKVTPDDEFVQTDFFYYLLKYIKPTFISIASNKQTTGLGHVTKADLRHIQVSFPTLDIQEDIVKAIKPIDDQIALLRETNATLEAIAQATFKSWFVDFDPAYAKAEGLEPDGMPPEIADLFPSEFENSKLGQIPKGWNCSNLAGVSEVGIGKTPPRKEPQWFSENIGDVRWVSIRDMGTSGTYIADTSEYLIMEAVQRFNVRVVPDNTVLLSFKMTMGRVCITDGKTTTNEAIAHFKLGDDSPLTSEYLYLHLRTFDYSRLSSTSSIADAVNSKTIRDIPVLIPPKEVIGQFGLIVNGIFEQIKLGQREITVLSELRDTLLPRLMSGKVCLSNKQSSVTNYHYPTEVFPI